MKTLPELFAMDDKLSDIDVEKIRKHIQEEYAAAVRAKVAEWYFQLLMAGAK